MLQKLGYAMSICALLVITGSALVLALPVGPSHKTQEAETTTKYYNADFVRDDIGYQRILRQLEAEAASSINDPGNFVGDDVPLEEIIRNLSRDEEAEQEHEQTAEPSGAAQLAENIELDSLPGSSEEALAPRTSQGSSSATDTAIETMEEHEDLETELPEESTSNLALTTGTDNELPVITSDEEFERVLAQLREEALNSISHPMNYAIDDSQLEKLVEHIDDLDLENLKERWDNNMPLIFEGDECPICREDIEEFQDFIFDTCSHKFHRECVSRWAIANKIYSEYARCPVCRRAGRLPQ